MTPVLFAWLVLVTVAASSIIAREREARWWTDELASLEVEAHAGAVPVSLAGLEQQPQILGNGAQQLEEGIYFDSTGFVVLAPDGPVTIEPGRDVTLIASNAHIADGTVVLPAGTELLLYCRVREPRQPPLSGMRFRLGLFAGERGTVLAEPGLRLLQHVVPALRVSRLRAALVAAAGAHMALHATQLIWALVLVCWLAALSYDATQQFRASWIVVTRDRDPRIWPAALARARASRQP